MFILCRAAVAVSFLILLNTAASAWPNLRSSFILGSGYTAGKTQSIWLYNTPEPGLQNTYTSDNPQRGTFLLGAGVDIPINNSIKNLESMLGVEIDYVRNPSINGVVHPMVNIAPNFDTLDYSYNMNSYLLLATGKLNQLNIYKNFGAYLHAGAGYACNRVSDYNETTPTGSSAAPMLAPFGNQSNTQFAFSVGAGFLWHTHQSEILIGYRYINAGHISLNISPIQQTNNKLRFSLCHHLLTLSLTV